MEFFRKISVLVTLTCPGSLRTQTGKTPLGQTLFEVLLECEEGLELLESGPPIWAALLSLLGCPGSAPGWGAGQAHFSLHSSLQTTPITLF